MRKIQFSEVQLLVKAWSAKGNPPCAHPELAIEYQYGMQGSGAVCTTCGEGFTPEEVVEWKARAASVLRDSEE